MSDEHGSPIGVSVVARDVSEQKAARRELEIAKHELERSNQELQEFASVASHDLKEPLRKVSAFSGRMIRRQADQLDAEGRDDLIRIDASATRMQALVDDLLAYARVSRQVQPFAPIDLADVTTVVLEDLAESIRETGARVSVGALPIVLGDESQLRQLVQNLLANAIKYRRPDVAPVISVSATMEDVTTAGAGLVVLTVRDDGIGFEPRYADRIFAPFERLHGRGQYDGTGIGLAICRRIAERHGGSIRATAAPGQGAAFTVRLPVARRAGPEGPAS